MPMTGTLPSGTDTFEAGDDNVNDVVEAVLTITDSSEAR